MLLTSLISNVKLFTRSLRLFAFLFLINNTYAQTSSTLHFQSITINNGLSQGFVSSIIQDKKGMMWFATGDGLNKFDGYNITIYHHDRDKPSSIASDDLTCVFEDSKGRLWVGTRHEGLDVFDRENNSFLHIRHGDNNSIRSNNILGIKEDQSGVLWIRTREGIDRMEINKSAKPLKNTISNELIANQLLFTHIRLSKDLEATRVKSGPENIFIDSWNQIFVTTNRKIFEVIYSPRKQDYQVLERYSFVPADPLFIPELIEDTTGHFLILNDKNITKFSGYDFKSPKKICSYNPSQLRWSIDKSETLWLADNNRFINVNLKTDAVKNIIPANYQQLKNIKATTDFFIDRTGIMWIGTGGYGILKFDPTNELFHHILPEVDTYQIIESTQGKIITNNMQEITINRDQTISIKNLTTPDIIRKKFPKLGVVAFTKDTVGNLWIGVNGGIISYNTITGAINQFNLPFEDQVSQPFPLYTGKDNKIWMGYNKYFVCYEPSAHSFSKFQYPVKHTSYDYDFLQNIYQDGNLLWLGSTNGLFGFDIQHKKIVKKYFYVQGDSTSLGNNFVLSFCRDLSQPEKYLWVGTKGGGLNLLDKTTGKFKRYDTKNGLVNNVVYGIQTDDRGNLWFSTNKGLSSLNIATNHFSNFDISDGLQSNEFNRYAYCKTKDGTMFFGGLNGINYFHPNDIKPLEPINVVFTDFRLFNKSVIPGVPGSPLSQSIDAVKSIRLRYEQNVVTFQFSALDYRKTGKILYRYKMQEFDKDYIYAGPAHEATYTNLDPGTYRFVVQASFQNESWGKASASLIVVIIPPWWRTWWFYLLVIVSTSSLIYALYRFRLNQLTRLEKLRNRIARDLHDEVGSSISTISIYSKIVHEQVDSPEFDNEPLLKKITDYTTEIMDSMNDIVWNINTKNDAFENIISRMREHASQLFEAKGYQLHFSIDNQLLRMKLSMERRRDFYLIYKEALNNIAKYANGKNVWITLTCSYNVIGLIIKDDGRGFNVTDVRKSSNGLINMNQRAEALKGKIKITSIPGAGTEILLSFHQH
ncbi:ligand-binding sensor domain-containing protein [Mucilaginibacter agri]|uniref:Histidine kinase domain-containing protein n=1 Tax=Mucilaginibacter agri TaxID=2695265 RepID=A0A965ZHH6_9SPHI|nr:sensor histidine kinase [Mucilaginibacter agri]NCD71115.1 hypothetical protein [Mucilaginibacter agri]